MSNDNRSKLNDDLSEDLDRRITELESLLMHQQQDFEALNETVLMNVNRLDRIMGLLTELSGKLDDVSKDEPPRTLEDDKPPHY